MTTIDHRTNNSTLEALDFTPTCEATTGPNTPECGAPADFHINHHDCEQSTDPCESFICADCLTEGTLMVQRFIDRAAALGGLATAGCTRCGHPIRKISDFIWNVQPIH